MTSYKEHYNNFSKSQFEAYHNWDEGEYEDDDFAERQPTVITKIEWMKTRNPATAPEPVPVPVWSQQPWYSEMVMLKGIVRKPTWAQQHELDQIRIAKEEVRLATRVRHAERDRLAEEARRAKAAKKRQAAKKRR